jgi:dihydrofolate reductase
MRKLRLQMQCSVDGLVAAGPNDDQQWVTWAWDEIRAQVLELIDDTDTIVLGRKLAEGYVPHWIAAADDHDAPMYELAQRIVAAKKVVFSRTMRTPPWPNTVLANGDLGTEIDALRRQPGKDMVVYGGTSLVSALIERRLIDEFNLFVNPVALGKGVPIFDRVNPFLRLRLVRSLPYASGIVLLTYEPR